MEYNYLGREQQANALANRILELEQQHYTNVLLVEECDIVNDVASRPQFQTQIDSLEPRIKQLKDKLDKLTSDIDVEDAEVSE